MRRAVRSALLFALVALAVSLLTPTSRDAAGQPKPAPPAIPKNYPTVTTPATFGAKRGATVEVTFPGTELASATGVWLSFPGKATLVEQKDPKAAVKAKIEVPADTPIGLHSLRLATAGRVTRAAFSGSSYPVRRGTPRERHRAARPVTPFRHRPARRTPCP